MRSPDAAAPFPTESPRGRRWRRIMCWWLPGLFAAWVLIGFLGVPLIVKKWIVPKIGQRLNGSIAVRECSFNPFTWRLVLRGAAVTDAAGTKVLAAEEIDANIEPLRTIFRTGWHASWARADGPYVRAELSPDGKLNIVELIKPDPDPSPPIERIPRVVVDDVIVRAGEVRLADRTPGRPVDLAWTGLAFTLTGVDTRPDHDNRYRLEASNSEGEKLAWTGGFQVNPLSSDGQVTIEGLGLARFDPYVDLHARAKLVDGRLNAKATYQFDPVAGRIIAGVQATVTPVKLDREEGRWIDLPLVEIKDIRLDAVKRELTVGAVEVSGGTISTDRDEQGRWFIERILKEAKPTGSGGSLPTATAAATQDRVDPQSIPFSVVRLERALTQLISDARGQWTVALDKLNVSQLTFGFVDRSGRAPVRIDLTQLGLTAGPVRSAEQFRTPMKLNAVFGRGTIAVDADLEPAVPRTKLDVDLKEIDLVILGPYLPMRLMTDLPPVELRRGLATVKGELRGEVGADRKIATRWEGTTSVAGITLVPAAGGDPLASVTGVAHTGVLTGERSPDGRAVSTFSGRGTLTGLAGDVPLAGGLSGAVETLDFDGTATATMDGAAATIELKGKSKAVNFAGTGRSLMGGSSVRLGSAELEGQAQLRVSETFAAEAKGKATLNSARAEAKDLNGAAATAGAQGLFADGSVSVRGGGGTGDVELAGDLAGAKVVFDAGNLAGPVQGAADRLGVSGKASASLAGANSTGSAEGGLRAESLRFDGRELLGPIDGTIGAAALTGRIEKGADWLAGSGDVEINSTKLNAAKLGDGKLEWSQLRLEKASLDSRSKEARIEAVVVNGPKATANVAILPREAGTASAGAGTVALTPADLRHVRPVLERLSAYSLAIGRAEIDGGVLQARDDASKPPASLLVEDLKGVLTGFATRTQSPMQFDASARVQNSGKLAINGTVDLKGSKSTADARMVVESMPLPPASAVSGRYLGYLIDSGRANCTLPVKVVDSTLSGELDFRLDGFELGREVESPDAPGVPVKLGVALLRDADNRVAGKLPFEGRLDDPDFNFGGLVWQAVLNLVVKAATAPFQLLGALFGGGSDADFSIVTFAPGSAELSPEMLGQLDKLGTGLTQRPSLNVRVIGGFDADVDAQGLKAAAWKTRALKAQRGGDQNAKPLSESEYADAVQDAWDALKIKTAKKPTVKQMEEAVIAAVAVTPEMLEDLAARRAAAVARELVVQGKIAEARVQVGKAADGKAAEEKKGGPAVHLELF